jgi:hypothetical protein
LWSDDIDQRLPEDVLMLLDIGGDAQLPAAQATKRLQRAHESGARRIHLVSQRVSGLIGRELLLKTSQKRSSFGVFESYAQRIRNAALRTETLQHARVLYETETIADCEQAAASTAAFKEELDNASPRRAIRRGHTIANEILEHAAARTTDFVFIDTLSLSPDGTEYVADGVFEAQDVRALLGVDGPVWPVALADHSTVALTPSTALKFSVRPAPSHPGAGHGDADCEVQVLFDSHGDAISASATCPEPFASAAEAACMRAQIEPTQGKVRTVLDVQFRIN